MHHRFVDVHFVDGHSLDLINTLVMNHSLLRVVTLTLKCVPRKVYCFTTFTNKFSVVTASFHSALRRSAGSHSPYDTTPCYFNTPTQCADESYNSGSCSCGLCVRGLLGSSSSCHYHSGNSIYNLVTCVKVDTASQASKCWQLY